MRLAATFVAVALTTSVCAADPAPIVEYKVVQLYVYPGLLDLNGDNHDSHGVYQIEAEALSAALTGLAAQGWEIVHCTSVRTHRGSADLDYYYVIYTLRREFPATSQYDIDKGWNLIGVGEMGQGEIPLASVSISDGSTTKTWGEAAAAGWIQAAAYRYETGSGYLTACTSGCDEDHFTPGCGYWMLTYVDGLTLLLP